MHEPLDQPTPSEAPASVTLGKVVLINAGIMLVYLVLTTVIFFTSTQAEAAIGVYCDIYLIISQVALNLLLGIIFFFTGRRRLGRTLFFAGLLTAATGYVVFWGKLFITTDIFGVGIRLAPPAPPM